MDHPTADTIEPSDGSGGNSSSAASSLSTSAPTSPTSSTTTNQLETLVEYVRANRENIRRTWGTASPQYHAANDIMQKYFNENIKKMNIDVRGASLEELIAKLSIRENDFPT